MKTLSEALALPGDGILCTSAIILDEKGRILLGLRHYKKKWEGELIANSLWTTPGGRTDEGETVGTCLVREAKEETMLDIVPIDYWGEIPAARSIDTLHVFRCSFAGEPQNPEHEKFERWDWFAFDDIPENFINPHLKELLREKMTNK